jgi:hypothetical protein
MMERFNMIVYIWVLGMGQAAALQTYATTWYLPKGQRSSKETKKSTKLIDINIIEAIRQRRRHC